MRKSALFLGNSVVCANLAFTAAAHGQALTGDNARDISRVIAPPVLQLNNLRNVMTVKAVRDLIPKDVLKNPQSASGQIVTWHGLTLNILAVDHVPQADQSGHQIHLQQYGPHKSAYALAMSHLAMFEVANAYGTSPHRYTSWVEGFLPGAIGTAPTNSSEPAAIVEAAYRVLIHLYPTFQADLKVEHDKAINAIGSGEAVTNGQTFGGRVATLILGIRANDKSGAADARWGVDFVPRLKPSAAGIYPQEQWQVDPVSQVMVALGSNWGDVTPFTLSSSDEFKLPDPPHTNDPKFKTAFTEVKTHGGDAKHNITRVGPDDEYFYAKFWSYDGTAGLCAPSRLYNQIADQVLMEYQSTIAPDLANEMSVDGAAEVARYYALVNVTLADAGIAAWKAKYTYQYWRPVTGIRVLDASVGPSSENLEHPKLDRQEVWFPLGAQTTNSAYGYNITPPFPSYPSGHAVFGSALFELLRQLVSNDHGFTFQSDEFNGKNSLGPNIDAFNFERCRDGDVNPLFCSPTKFDTFAKAEKSNSESRIWMGVHWRFDADQGEELGHKVGDAVVQRAFVRVNQ